MKILFAHFGLYRKNGWGRTFELAKGLARLGNEVTIICSKTGKFKIVESTRENGVRVLSFYDILPSKLLASGYGVISLLNKLFFTAFTHFDVVQTDSHRDSAYYPCVVNRLFYKSKLYIEWWDNFKAKTKYVKSSKWYSSFFSRREIKQEESTKINADGCVVLSRLLFQRALNLGVPKERILILNGGSDVENIKCLPSNLAKQELGIDQKTLTFGFIGMGDTEYPDLANFFVALDSLMDSPDIIFLNFGRPFNLLYERFPSLKSRILECGWIDYYKDTHKFSAVDVFVLTKIDNVINNSGWPTKFGDYLACGRPIFLNMYGELVSFNNQYNFSFINVSNEPDDIKNKIIAIRSGAYDLLSMGNNNRMIAEKVSWFNKSKLLLDFYNR